MQFNFFSNLNFFFKMDLQILKGMINATELEKSTHKAFLSIFEKHKEDINQKEVFSPLGIAFDQTGFYITGNGKLLDGSAGPKHFPISFKEVISKLIGDMPILGFLQLGKGNAVVEEGEEDDFIKMAEGIFLQRLSDNNANCLIYMNRGGEEAPSFWLMKYLAEGTETKKTTFFDFFNPIMLIDSIINAESKQPTQE